MCLLMLAIPSFDDSLGRPSKPPDPAGKKPHRPGKKPPPHSIGQDATAARPHRARSPVTAAQRRARQARRRPGRTGIRLVTPAPTTFTFTDDPSYPSPGPPPPISLSFNFSFQLLLRLAACG